MRLHTLDASNNTNITNAGIKHMQLHKLIAWDNPNITNAGIMHMQPCSYIH
jgi:hypothetical protein